MNLELYNKVRVVPDEAQKPIGGGRLKGMTDINPMWRIKTLTEQFGPCGKGWYFEILEERIEEGANGEKVAFTKINLYVKYGEEWSKPVQGTGGSSFIAKERSGLYTSDECFKMALTDAISVSCKSLGIGADIYYAKDRTKYSVSEPTLKLSADKVKVMDDLLAKLGGDYKKTILSFNKVKSLNELTETQYGRAMLSIKKKMEE